MTRIKEFVMVGVLVVALVLAGCGEGAAETPTPAASSTFPTLSLTASAPAVPIRDATGVACAELKTARAAGGGDDPAMMEAVAGLAREAGGWIEWHGHMIAERALLVRASVGEPDEAKMRLALYGAGVHLRALCEEAGY